MLYLLVALSLGIFDSRERFPLFTGKWFYQTPHTFDDYGLKVSELDSAPIEPPIYLEKMYSRVRVWPFAAYGAIQDLGKKSQTKNRELAKKESEVSKLIFESRKFKATLFKRKLNSVEFVKHGTVLSEEALLEIKNN